MRKLTILLIAWTASFSLVLAQETFPVNGVQDERSEAYAFTNAIAYQDYQTKIENATLLIKDGKIISLTANGSVPEGYTIIDLKGKYIYPGLIDMHTTYGIPEPKREPSPSRGEQFESKKDGPYNPNEAIKSEFSAFEVFEVNEKAASAMRKLGFGSVLSLREDGIARGTSVLVSLGAERENKVILKSEVAAHYSFSKGTSTQNYPSSSMGYIALLRQTYMDSDWYYQLKNRDFVDKSLEAWRETQSLPQIFSTTNWLSTLRADKLGEEFGVQYIIKTGSDLYQRADAVKNTGAALIVPVNYPDAYDVSDPLETYELSLENMKHWELAPTNLASLESKDITFAITTHDLKDKKKFWPNVRKAIEMGLSKTEALKALTHTPAELLKVSDQLGSIKKDYVANFIICSDELFAKDMVIHHNWIQGKPFVLSDLDSKDLSGKYELIVAESSYPLQISGKPGKHSAKIVMEKELKVSFKVDGENVTLGFQTAESKSESISLSGWINNKNLQGQGQMANGDWVSWKATWKEVLNEKKGKDKKKKDVDKPELGEVTFPFMAYGTTSLPKQEHMLIQNTTVWTMEENGKLENTDVRLRDGKIAEIGKNLATQGAKIVDGTGKHLTPGIIDEHSHIGATSINDVATNSGMVRIGDVVSSEDQEIYRALSGGVTAIQILHGSANPIGGQSALIKLRWGSTPEEMKIKGADGYIKFALGENVKRARSSSSIRFPQTRMGVEQVYVDAFTAAKDYEKKWNAYNALSDADKANAEMPRRDLALDAMADIINKKLFISCHSYVQSEINMLMKVAEMFDFRVNTFTHILEGYKVADKMAAHGAGGSTFADWWAYKWEVRYAIPYNPALMVREGVVTAINSDDAEMMRRLNQEAGKSLKYGGLSEEEALAMVTINPAKLLHLEDRMGSIKEGKDADLVLWTNHPLSIYARAEKTIVDGKVYFDIEKDQELKHQIQLERARLVQKMKDAKSKGGKTQRPGKSYRHHWHCEDVVTYQD